MNDSSSTAAREGSCAFVERQAMGKIPGDARLLSAAGTTVPALRWSQSLAAACIVQHSKTPVGRFVFARSRSRTAACRQSSI